ncbi:MAG: hypothetical protein WCO23_05295 [bacterium]
MKISENQILSHNLFRIKYTELNEIYLMMSLRSFACSLVAIFAPIYLYTLGFSLRDILIYFIIIYTVEAMFEWFSAVAITKVGPKKLIAYSIPLLIIHFWLFKTIPTYNWPLWFVAIEAGFLLALFWQPYHYDFSKAKHRAKSNSELSKLYITIAILGAIAPFVGGIIATHLGISYLFGLVIALLFLSILPLFQTSEKYISHHRFSLKNIKFKDISKDVISFKKEW